MLCDHAPLPVHVDRFYGDVFGADGREFYHLHGSRHEVVKAINSYDGMLDMLRETETFLSALAKATPLGYRAVDMIKFALIILGLIAAAPHIIILLMLVGVIKPEPMSTGPPSPGPGNPGETIAQPRVKGSTS